MILVLLVFALLCEVQGLNGNWTDGNWTIKISDSVDIPGHNATFFCQIVKNTSEGIKHDYDYANRVNLQWTFTPVGSNTTYVLLGGDDKYAPAWNAKYMLGENTNVSPPGNYPTKYDRVVWTDLTVVSVTPEDAGKYTCCLTDSGISGSAELFVIDRKPECTVIDQNQVFYQGDNVTLTCSVRFYGNKPPYVEWIEPPLHVDYQHLTLVHQSTNTNVSTSIHMKLQHMIDGKPFLCKVGYTDLDFANSCTSIFPPESVHYAPFITGLLTNPQTEPHNRQVYEGQNLTIYCTAHGIPAITWSWMFVSDENVTREGFCKLEVCPLRNMSRTDAGTYTCSVSNVIRNQTRMAVDSIHIAVLARPPGIPTARPKLQASTQPHDTKPLVTEFKGKGVSPYAVGAIVCAGLAVILIIVFILLALKMKTRERRLHDRLTRMHDENLDDQEVELLDENIQPDNTELPAEYGRLKQQWEIARKDIRLVDLIAKGTFVEVWRGRMRKYPRRNEIMKVAIKRINPEATEKERKFFLAELEVLKAIQPHPNILPLIGCYTGSDPWLMMVEYALEGSLYQFLQHRRPGDLHVEIHAEGGESVSLKNQNLTAVKLLSLAAQCVSGLQHINRFKMIYYRLRAASVLVCKNGICKLSGFSFVPDITERNRYEINSAPVRWMSPESLLDNIYNVKTDVWSFGILLWEIVHFGHLPYPDMGPHEVSEKIHTGYRMPQPPHCSGDIYNLMLMCWAQSPDNRPSFGDIMQNLTHLAENADAHICIDRLPEGLKSSDIIDNTSAMA